VVNPTQQVVSGRIRSGAYRLGSSPVHCSLSVRDPISLRTRVYCGGFWYEEPVLIEAGRRGRDRAERRRRPGPGHEYRSEQRCDGARRRQHRHALDPGRRRPSQRQIASISRSTPAPSSPGTSNSNPAIRPGRRPPGGETGGAPASASQRASDAIRNNNVPRKDVFTAAEGVFGRGAEGLGDMIEKLLRDHGEPTAYITGREAGGAFVIGVRYGSGTLHHQIEGDRPVYWTGPSVGIDFGADASKVFVLVYNLTTPRTSSIAIRRRRAMPMSSAASPHPICARRHRADPGPPRRRRTARHQRRLHALQRAQSLGSVLTRA